MYCNSWQYKQYSYFLNHSGESLRDLTRSLLCMMIISYPFKALTPCQGDQCLPKGLPQTSWQ